MASVYTILKRHDPGIQYERNPLSEVHAGREEALGAETLMRGTWVTPRFSLRSQGIHADLSRVTLLWKTPRPSLRTPNRP